MAFYDEIAEGINYKITANTEEYLKVVDNTILLPNPKWLMWHFNYLDKIVEACSAFKQGVLIGKSFDLSSIEKHIIGEAEEGISFLRFLNTNYSLFSIDIETSNLLTDASRNHILCIGIAYSKTQAVTFKKSCFDNSQFCEAFQNFLNKSKNCFILHNGLFDRSRTKILANIDIPIGEDTMLMHYCGINEHRGTHGLKDLAQLYLGYPEWEKPLDTWKRDYCRRHKVLNSDFQYDYFDQDVLAEYNCYDVTATYGLYLVFKDLMRKSSITIYRKLIESCEYYANMISRGMLMDMKYWQEMCDTLEKQIFGLEDYLFDTMSGASPSSPKQLMTFLKQRFPFDNIGSTDKEAIEALQEKHPEDEFLSKLLEYRKATKYLKTYGYGLYKHKDYQDVIHCEFKLHGTETGRLASSNPNMQNIPRNHLIKKLFIARPGYTLINLDYSQSELRVMAYICNDENMKQTYRDGRDLHSEMAKHMFKDKYDPHDKEQRIAAKTVNFGIPYGRTAGGIAKQLNVSMTVAKQYLDSWFAAAPKVKTWIEEMHRMALADPQEVYYTVFGRARHYYVTGETIHHVKNQSVNFPISSTANDLTIYALCEIGKWLKENKLDAYPVNTVHDSIVIECKPEIAKMVAEKCQSIMQEVPQKLLPHCDLPFRADAEIGTCYGEMAEPDWDSYEEELENETTC